MKKPLPPFIKAMKAKADAKTGMHTMPDGKKMKDSAMKKPKGKPFSQGGSASSRADGKAIHAPTQGTMVKMKRGGGC